jgi:DNA-directed RNA polymerase subunit M/transcription elongation factor TFIIS
MKDGRYALFCENCDLFLGITSDLKEKESLIKPAQIFEGVVNDENEFADYKHVCKKCGFNKAQIIDMGVFYSDEDNLIFLKCGKCGYSERVGRKTS